MTSRLRSAILRGAKGLAAAASALVLSAGVVSAATTFGTSSITTTGTLQVDGNATFDTNTLFVDSTNNRVGVGNAAPAAAFSVGSSSQLQVDSSGNLTTSGLLGVSSAVANADKLLFAANGSGGATFSGTLTSADLTAARTWSLPDASGNVVIDGATQTLSNKTLTAPALTGPVLLTSAAGGSSIALTVKADGSQSANLQEWQNSTGAMRAAIDNNGNLLLTGNGGTVFVTAVTTQTANLFNTTTTTLNVGGQASAVNIGSSSGTTSIGHALSVNKGAQLFTGAAANKGLVVKGFSGQTASLQEWQDSGATVLASVGADGSLKTTGSLTLGAKTSDPTGADGMTYYNSATTKFRCYEAGAWKDCDTAAALSGGTAGRVAYWTGASALSNDAAFLWDAVNHRLTVGAANMASDVFITNDSAINSAAATVLTLTHSTTSTAAAGIGASLLFRAEDTIGNTENAGEIVAKLTNPSDASETSALSFRTRIGGGALSDVMTISGSGLVTVVSNLSVGNGKLQINATGDITGAISTLDGSGTTSSVGTNATSLVLSAGNGTNFDVGNYVQVASTNCASGVNTCYAKITAKTSDTLTISPQLSWTSGSNVTEVHIPEIGGTDIPTPSTLANRFGRGYFIDGVQTGNGSTTVGDGLIDSAGTLSLNTVNNQAITTGSGLFTAGGNAAVTGTLTVGGGTSIAKHLSATQASVTTSSVGMQACANYATITVTGAAVGDTVVAAPTAVAGGIETVNLTWSAHVSAADTVVIRACNPTLGAINTADTQTWRVDVWKH